VISSHEVRRAVAVVQRSGVATDLEALLRPVEQGRPRALTVEAFLVGVLLTVRYRKSVTLTNVHDLLTREISVSQQLELGYRRPGWGAGPAVTLRQVRYLLSALAARLDEADMPAGPDDDPEPEARPTGSQRSTLQSILDRLLAATMPRHVVHHGAYAVDETAVQSWSRGNASFDADASWGYRTANLGQTDNFFGYGVFAFTRVPAQGDQRDQAPVLTERIVVRPANADVVEPVLTEIDLLRGEGRPVTEILADRAWSYKAADRWAMELRTRGIEQTVDLHPQDARPQPLDGLVLLAGVPHCPFTPEADSMTAFPGKSASKKRKDDFRAANDLREQFALRKVANADAAGRERWQCPAVAGKVRCGRRPVSTFLPSELPAVQVPAAAAVVASPKCCTQKSVTVPVTAQAKLRQRHYWGSAAWETAYRRRTYVEGAFGNLKNRNAENVTRGWIQVVGIVKTSLMIAAAVAAANLRLLRIWAARTRDFEDPIANAEPAFAGFEELPAPVVEGDPSAGPPSTP